MNRHITSHQVAKRAGVSRSTVSLILNDVPGMKFADDTRERVLKAAAELRYVPSAAARSLASGEARTLICRAEHLLVDAFIPQVLYGMNEVSRQYGYNVLIEGLENIPSDDTYFELVRAKRIDGLIVLNPSEHDTTLPKLIQEGFPIVIFGSDIGADDFKGGQLATKHLLDLGHRRIAHITFAPEDSVAAKSRMAGYQQALEDAGITFDEALIRQGNYDAASGYAAMGALLEETDFSAVFVSNDTVALGAMTAIQQRGLKIPEDIAVIGYDDIPVAAYLYPSLSTIRNFPVQEGKLATKRLIELIRGERKAKESVVFDTPLIVRDSCGGTPKT